MLHNPLDNRFLYNIYDLTMRSLQPYSDYCLTMFKRSRRMAETLNLPIHIPFVPEAVEEMCAEMLHSQASTYRRMAGYYFIAHMLTKVYDKPQFDIGEIKLHGDFCEIREEIVDKKTFCNLLHFKKMDGKKRREQKILLVAPMSGHHATLLRNTVRDLLKYYDVYITDWVDARDVPLIDGSFDLDDFVEYVVSYFQMLSPDLHVMAVCQPTVPVLIALALVSANNSEALPCTAILLGGPIDTSQSPTAVNKLASSRGDDWFEQNVISMVPNRFPGAMRIVYPGFMQLAGFMSMNLQRHIESLLKAIDHYADDNRDAALKTVRFYLEYFSTMDLTAEFYMQTINTVFQARLLTTGNYKSHGRSVSLKNIKHTAILAIEGSRDDITGVGQTKSVLNLCENLEESKKKYVLADVGHYGLFNGSKFRSIIIPQIREFTKAHSGRAQARSSEKKDVE